MAGWDDITDAEIDEYLDIDTVVDIDRTVVKKKVNIWVVLGISLLIFLLVFFLLKNKK